jgi:hypothetical protein
MKDETTSLKPPKNILVADSIDVFGTTKTQMENISEKP